MSMQLNCEYSEVFSSKLNKELTFVDSLNLFQTRSTDAYIFMYWSDDGKVQIPDKTNQQIFDSYCAYVLKEYPYLSEPKPYATDRDESIRLALGLLSPEDCKTVYYKTSYDSFLERANEFFDKYGGIENVEFYVS